MSATHRARPFYWARSETVGATPGVGWRLPALSQAITPSLAVQAGAKAVHALGLQARCALHAQTRPATAARPA